MSLGQCRRVPKDMRRLYFTSGDVKAFKQDYYKKSIKTLDIAFTEC
jgi:hypothetical protein